MIRQKQQVVRKEFNQQNKRSLGVLMAGDSCCQHGGPCKEALNLDWEMGVEMHMKEKFILQGSQHSFFVLSPARFPCIEYVSVKLKQWFDITEMENVFLCLLSPLCLMVPGPTLLLHASLHRLWCSSLNSPQRAIIEKPQQKGPANRAEFSVHKQEQAEVTSLQVANCWSCSAVTCNCILNICEQNIQQSFCVMHNLYLTLYCHPPIHCSQKLYSKYSFQGLYLKKVLNSSFECTERSLATEIQ